MKLNPKLTKDIQQWLDTPEDQRDIRAGADLMLSLNRNRALYNSILKHPEKFLPKLIYELKKYLKIRLANMTTADVARMQQQVMPRVDDLLTHSAVITSEAELPEGVIAAGRRADHDSLPAEIRALWDTNAARYRQIQLLFNECKALSYTHAPCDLFTKLTTLAAAEKKYRRNLELYDSYQPGTPLPADVVDSVAAAADSSALANARKTLSKYRAKVSKMSADDPQRPEAIEKIRAAASVISAAGAAFAPATLTDLAHLGIVLK